MASRKKVRPTPVPSGPVLLRPAVGVLVLSLSGAVDVGCKIQGEPPMNPPDPPMPPMVEPPMDDAPPPPMVAPMPAPMPPPVEGDSVDQEELPPMPPPPEGGFDGSGGPPPMPNPGNRPEPTPKTDATP